MISLDQTTCRSWIKEMLQAAGTHQEAAHRAADIFVRSSLRQTGHHDISYLPQRLELLQRGTIIPAGKMELLFDTPAFSRWDGHGALGEYNCSLLLEKTMEKAKQLGLAMGTVRHSNHFLAGHPYGQIAAEKGCMAIVWSNTDPCMGDPEAKARIIGNNPMGFGAPGAENPLILDLCMAYSSLGNLTDRIEQNREIPAYWGRNSQGEYSKSPQELMEGGVCAPMGEHKGFGLAMMHELLAGGLSGGEMGPQVQPLGGWKTHSQSILVINLETTDSLRDWETRMGNLRDDMNQALGNRVRMPGDHLYEMADQQADQILLNEKTMKKLQHFSKNHRVKIPDSK